MDATVSNDNDSEDEDVIFKRLETSCVFEQVDLTRRVEDKQQKVSVLRKKIAASLEEKEQMQKELGNVKADKEKISAELARLKSLTKGLNRTKSYNEEEIKNHHKQLAETKRDIERKSAEWDEILQDSRDLVKRYYDKYKSIPLAVENNDLMAKIVDAKERLKIDEENLAEKRSKIAEIIANKPGARWKRLTEKIIHIAKAKLETNSIVSTIRQIEDGLREVSDENMVVATEDVLSCDISNRNIEAGEIMETSISIDSIGELCSKNQDEDMDLVQTTNSEAMQQEIDQYGQQIVDIRPVNSTTNPQSASENTPVSRVRPSTVMPPLRSPSSHLPSQLQPPPFPPQFTVPPSLSKAKSAPNDTGDVRIISVSEVDAFKIPDVQQPSTAKQAASSKPPFQFPFVLQSPRSQFAQTPPTLRLPHTRSLHPPAAIPPPHPPRIHTAPTVRPRFPNSEAPFLSAHRPNYTVAPLKPNYRASFPLASAPFFLDQQPKDTGYGDKFRNFFGPPTLDNTHENTSRPMPFGALDVTISTTGGNHSSAARNVRGFFSSPSLLESGNNTGSDHGSSQSDDFGNFNFAFCNSSHTSISNTGGFRSFFK